MRAMRWLTAGLAALLALAPPALARPTGDGDLVNPSRCNTRIGGLSSGPPDPGSAGPFAVDIADYSFGDEALALQDFDHPVEFRGRVAYPEDLACGPFPIVFVLHGGNESCFDDDGELSNDWPCPAGFDPVPNHLGYDGLTSVLASHGIIGVSVSANGLFPSGTAAHRAELLQRHLELWWDLDAAGAPPFGNLFRGRVDLGRVGTLGHSLGGEGVLAHVHYDAAAESPFGVKAVLVIAPTSLEPELLVNGVPLGVLLPYCDGDETELAGVRHFDGTRYNQPGDRAPKYTFEVIGANHANYNAYWDPAVFGPGAADDWAAEWFGNDLFCNFDPDDPVVSAASGRLTGAEQRATAVALASAFFREHLRNDPRFRPFLRGSSTPPPSAQTDGIHVGYHPADEPESRRDVNRFTAESDLGTNHLGGAVTADGLLRFEWCDDPFAGPGVGCLENLHLTPAIGRDGRAPHAFGSNLGQLRLAWARSTGTLSHDIPAPWRDVSGYDVVQFRAAVDVTDPLNPPGSPQDLTVELVDGAGVMASTTVAAHSAALFYPPSHDDPIEADSAVPRVVLNTVRIPLRAFGGVFLQDIRAVRLVFDRIPSGALNMADLMFADEATDPPPAVEVSVDDPILDGGAEKLTEVGLHATASDDGKPVPVTVDVFSDEDDLDSEVVQRSPDASDIAPSTLRLRAESDKNADGRVYVVVVRAAGAGGAAGFACATVVVPNGQHESDLAGALSQGEAAAESCTAFAAAAAGLVAPPAGFFVVGDGPVIGPDQ
ncbi:MAG: hypothetical protein ACRD03_15225 [Acidimicrobiales bacterium]